MRRMGKIVGRSLNSACHAEQIHTMYVIHTYVNTYIRTEVSMYFGFLPLCTPCQNYDKIMRPFLRKNIKTKAKAIAIHTMYICIYICMYISLCDIRPNVRPDTVTPTTPTPPYTLSHFRLKMTRSGRCAARRSGSPERSVCGWWRWRRSGGRARSDNN